MKSQIENNFMSHGVSTADGLFMEGIRTECKNLALDIDAACPNSREKSVAMTKLEEVMFWANAAISRNK